MNAPPFPMNPGVGDYAGNWVWNGNQWVPTTMSGQRVVVQTFTASGAYMPSPGMTSCVVECWGGGGGGGGALSSLATQILGGGAGGSGGYSRKALDASLVAGGVVVTIGAGGPGAPAGGTATIGGQTTFGALCVAWGGGGGMGNSANATAYGAYGAGAPAGTGDVAFPGAPGQNGSSALVGTPNSFTYATAAGGELNGGGVLGLCSAGEETAGGPSSPNTGAGGAGGIVNQFAGGGVTGGSGASGLCVVTEYCWGVSGGGGGGCAPIPITDGSCGGWGPGSWR